MRQLESVPGLIVWAAVQREVGAVGSFEQYLGNWSGLSAGHEAASRHQSGKQPPLSSSEALATCLVSDFSTPPRDYGALPVSSSSEKTQPELTQAEEREKKSLMAEEGARVFSGGDGSQAA